MPPPEEGERRQTAILWAVSPSDGLSPRTGPYGEIIVEDPVEIRVRWVDRSSQTIGPTANTISYDSVAVVGQAIPIGSLMWLGTLEDYYGTGEGDVQSNRIMQVDEYKETPDLKGREVLRSVGLMRYKNRLPENV